MTQLAEGPGPALPATPHPAAPATEAASPSTWSRFHLVAGGGFNFPQTDIYVDNPIYERAAPEHRGGHFFLQPGFSVFSHENADVRLGFHYGHHFFSSPQSSANRSNYQSLSLAAFVEASYLPHRHFGFGGQARLGWTSISADQVDVGLPVTANFAFGSDNAIGLGASLFVTTWNQAIRLGLALDTTPGGGIHISVPPPDAPIPVHLAPRWGVFGGVDIFQIIRNAQE